MSNFVHLHAHTEYSALDGMGKIKEMFETAKELGQSALAITDHGTSAGLYEAQRVADELGMKAILGQEFYYERENDGKNGHLLVLAKNNVGLRNIFKMQEYGFVHNFYYNPRINWEVLKEFSEGLIVTSACLGSTFNQYLIEGEYEKAKEWARKFQDVFGGDFYIEIQPNDIPEQHTANKGSIRIADELGIEIVATNDIHYTNKQDDFAHEVLLAMQVKKKMSDENRFKFPDNAFWLKSEDEMRETFAGIDEEHVERAIANTKVIADKCNARIETGRYLPQYYNIPEGKTARELLVEHVMEGARRMGYSTNREFMEDVQAEIDIIDSEGYSDYFLIVMDYINSAREKGVVVGDGRGSGSGSKVAYLLNIHQVPPHEYNLLFERFMAKGRTPDIDSDFSDQEAVFADLQEKYGENSVARIATYGRMTARSVVRRVLSAFDIPYHKIGQITREIPEGVNKLSVAYQENPKLLEYKKEYPLEWEVIERLEGTISHVGTHAGGVIIYPDLPELLPIITTSQDRSKRVVAYDMDIAEEIGFYKFDVLGLETVSNIRRCLDSIKKLTGDELDLAKIDYEDQEVYNLLCKGDLSGVFQLNQQATKVMEQQPRSFEDLIAINALIRPGIGDWEEYIARRRGKPYKIYGPRKFYMEETEGIITYQEQYLLDAHVLAGWGVAYADKHIRKNKSIRDDEELKSKFIQDCVNNGHEESVAEGVWEEIEEAVAGGYSFNKAHSASYARLSYQTAYLKTHYPTHFYAALMSGEDTDNDGQNAISAYIAECKEKGINVLPPNINSSSDVFTVNSDGSINYRVTTIKHVGKSAIKHIDSLRPIASFKDFLSRRERRYVKKNVMTNLIKAGAFDFDNPNRAELLWEFEMSERTRTQINNDEQLPRHEWNDEVKCEWEKEVLGMYLSAHPMEKYGFKPLDEYEEGQEALQGGEVSDVFEFHPRRDPSNPKMAFVTIDTLFGSVKLVVFASYWSRKDVREACTEGNIILVRGKRSGNDVLLNSVEIL